MRTFHTALGLFVLLFLPLLLGVYKVDQARHEAFFASRISYVRHLPAPESAKAIYDILQYHPADIRKSNRAVPRLYLADLPPDMNKASSVQERKRRFIAVMLPLILRTNELIEEDRKRLHRLMEKIAQRQNLVAYERTWLRRLARQYGIKREKLADVTKPAVLQTLYRRVDTIPPSLAIAQAAIESGWGTSRFARQGNAIYGQWTWNDEDAGIIPKKRGKHERHRIRAFDFLIDSVRSYARNLNRNPAYQALRETRAERRISGKTVTGLALAPTLIRYSTRREAYVADLRKIITGNRLTEFDYVRLEQSKNFWLARSATTTSARRSS